MPEPARGGFSRAEVEPQRELVLRTDPVDR